MDLIDARLGHARAAFLWACRLDVAVRKPGNVSHASCGHGMQAQDFLASAEVSARALFTRGAPVGARIEAAVTATRAKVGCNTNLGILLLCAPLAAALERVEATSREAIPAVRSCALRRALEAVLARLDIDDASAAYRAIALANPGGLGRSDEQDVAAAPTINLRAAMTLAAERDSIARQYRDGYAAVFDWGLAHLDVVRVKRVGLAAAVQSVFLRFLATWPDTHIVRKFGIDTAQTVTADGANWLARLNADPAARESADFRTWDEALKAAGINPGTSADLTVCALFTAALSYPEIMEIDASKNWHGS